MKNILVVDDNELLCRLACDILHTEGYQATAVTTASDALAALKNEKFDLLVTNFAMPGMNGLELARAIRDRDLRLPVIVMTTYEPVECEHVTLWLPKEYLFPNLLEKIRMCLSEIGTAIPENDRLGAPYKRI
jgi:CheY-like chemotaxis protein